MKKDVTETRTFCDYCEQLGYTECMVCEKDLCHEHRVELVVYLDRQDRAFRASLCPEDAVPLGVVLKMLQGKSTSWKKAGHNPEFNEARLIEIIQFLAMWIPANRV